MSDRVNDRRRFDPDGNPRTPQQASAESAPEPRADTQQGQPPPPAEETESDTSAAEEAESRAISALREELDGARKRVDELARAYQALHKDRDEFKARLNRERERMIDVERGKVASALLEAIDELDRALSATPPDDASPLAQGVRLIRTNLLQKANATGIERLDVVGQTFDPNTMEAADMEMTTDESEDQKVLADVRAGYKLNNQLIRPARVKVAKYVRPADA